MGINVIMYFWDFIVSVFLFFLVVVEMSYGIEGVFFYFVKIFVGVELFLVKFKKVVIIIVLYVVDVLFGELIVF